MAVSVDNRPSRLRTALAAVLTVLVLVPVGVLFLWVWTDTADERDSTQLEQQGVQYLTALNPLISGLAEAESSALSGVSAPPAALSDAVGRVNEIDQQLGDALRTHERWTGLRDKISRLAGVSGDPVTVFTAHVEVTDLALALYNTVRNNSALVRDPYNDISHLQQAMAVDLPGAVVHVSRMGDLSMLVAGASAKQKAVLAPQFGAEVQQVNTSVDSLTDNLQAAVDDTDSTTLSGNLVSTLDSFRRGVESLTRGANPGGTPDASTMATAQTQLQTSLTGLAGVTLREMGSLLEDRMDALNLRRVEIMVAGSVAVLLVLVAVAVWMTTAMRRRPAPPDRVPGETTRDMRDMTPSADRGYGGSSLDTVPSFGDPTRRERSGALR
ncbi:hypothetical protein [Mangrovihabitans endophyticus]|uniref:Uncharacterized protein n=1 Tax=Mangrovihabitans endophyticus TaxID=1751298 RepID=A0A8J3C3T2_9ACTN|nr:hypothetical protein [Mangrovihabitans endophyticus]GGL05486.1 hypothetical protein GCM10012284_44920 [Mangrovihabitans endophyticus]